MKVGDLIIDNEIDDDEKIGIILEVQQDDVNRLIYLDVLYPSGIYEVEVEIPRGDASRFEVVSESR